MTSLNTILWSLGVALHLLLLMTLVRRGIAQRLPAFTGLISFYLLRSLLLYGLSGHVQGPAYALFSSALSTLDLVLQSVVAWELFSTARRAAPGLQRVTLLHRLAMFAGFALAAAGMAWSLSLWVPAHPRTPIDRGVLFTCLLMLAVAAASVGRRLQAPACHVMRGFCALSITGILCQVERTLAGFHRDAATFQRWSYPAAVIYLIVLSFWLLSLFERKRQRGVLPRGARMHLISPAQPLRCARLRLQ
jgi:hypothetical protein